MAVSAAAVVGSEISKDSTLFLQGKLTRREMRRAQSAERRRAYYGNTWFVSVCRPCCEKIGSGNTPKAGETGASLTPLQPEIGSNEKLPDEKFV